MTISVQLHGPEDSAAVVVLAHGAGQGMDSGFMQTLAGGLASFGYRVVLFDFPYMTRAKEEGKSRPPDRMPVLLETFAEVVAAHRKPGTKLIVGGKSMGGRAATMIARSVGADGYLVFGYPFHPPGKPDHARVAHLEPLRVPGLIIQGTRDPFGKPDEVSHYPLNDALHVFWIDEGDHSLAPSKRSGLSPERSIARALHKARDFIKGL
ncbi:MAG: alpha/beta fold hydrolase [Alphaproteobacteria bacterium]|nr:alpha/beta fold hydrolase [Alphaproteobacteria bacterium]